MTDAFKSAFDSSTRGPIVTWEKGRDVIRGRCGTAASMVEPGEIGGRDLYGGTQISICLATLTTSNSSLTREAVGRGGKVRRAGPNSPIMISFLKSCCFPPICSEEAEPNDQLRFKSAFD
jgi:hypothetical protein